MESCREKALEFLERSIEDLDDLKDWTMSTRDKLSDVLFKLDDLHYGMEILKRQLEQEGD